MPDRILHPCAAVISDVHVGSPENARLEDFDRDEDFARLLDEVIPRRAGGRKATLIINGDFIDFPQILPELGKKSPDRYLGTTEEESRARVERAIAGHPKVFQALRRFLEAQHQVLLLPGNHDIDLHFPAVRAALRAALGDPAAPAFDFVAEGVIEQRRVHIEHGNQCSFDNFFKHWSSPILEGPDGAPRVERPWGTLFMDIVYNDIEGLYPFVNKVYPQSALAGIILRLVREDPQVSLRAIAELLAFFVRKGKRMALGHLLGEEEEQAAGQPALTRSDIEQALRDLDAAEMDPGRRGALIDEVAALTGATEAEGAQTDEEEGEEGEPAEGLLGRTDERGLNARARELWQSGTVDVVVFGHTHDPVDRTQELAGRTCRLLNTGGWVPRIVVAPGAKPTLAELQSAPWQHELYYAWLELEFGAAAASLERLG